MSGEGRPAGTVAAAPSAGSATIHTRDAHGLSDGDRVRISTVVSYVKTAGANSFSCYQDAALKRQSVLNGIVSGDPVDCLNVGDWAVVAGITHYPGFTNQLEGPVRDANAFKRWVLRRGFVPDDQVKLIQSPQEPPIGLPDAKPTVGELTDAFLNLARAASPKPNRKLGRRLYIFLSGHGIAPTLGATVDYKEAALLAANADRISLSYHLCARAYAEWFRVRGVFEEVILFTDCCRDLEDNVPPQPTILPQWDIGKNPEGRSFYAFPTMLGFKAYERALGEPPEVRGIFSWVVVNALNNPKLYNEQGVLLASSLEDHIYSTVPSYNGSQDPLVEYLHKPPHIVLAKWFNRAQQRVQITFKPPAPGAVADLYRGSSASAPLGSHPADEDWIDYLDAGLFYKVAIRGTQRSHLFEVQGNDEVQCESF